MKVIHPATLSAASMSQVTRQTYLRLYLKINGKQNPRSKRIGNKFSLVNCLIVLHFTQHMFYLNRIRCIFFQGFPLFIPVAGLVLIICRPYFCLIYRNGTHLLVNLYRPHAASGLIHISHALV